MANRIDIDPRLILPWTTGTQYRIAVTQGLVIEEGNNRNPSPAISNSKTFTTPTSGPTIIDTFPDIGTTNISSTGTLNYNRPVYETTASTNFYLYRETTGTDILVATIPNTSSRITHIGKDVAISFRDLLVPNFKHYLTADQGIYTDLFNFASPAITTSTIFNYVPGPGADVLTVVPTFGATNQFHNKVNVTYNKNISRINSGSYYLNYESSGTIRTFNLTSSSVVVTSTANNVQITFDDMILPEGEYFITNDGGIFTDQHNFPYPEVYDNSKIKWSNTSISNMGTLRYRGEAPTAIFTATNPRVIDVDLNTATQYTFTLSAPIGTFSSTQGGTSTSGVWTFTGTKTQINNLIEGILFTTNQQENPPTTYTYSLSKNGVTLVNKTKDLIGILLLLGAPGPTGKAFPRLTLSLAGTNVIDETITMTANISTSTTLAGVVEFKSGNTVISTATISSGGVASITTAFSTTGTRFLSASWLGGQLPTDGFRYEPLDSFDTLVNITAAQRLPSDPVIGFTNVGTLRVPVGPELEIRGTLPISGLGGEITFNQITEVTTATTTPTPVNITIQSRSASGVNFPPAGPFESTEAWAITVNNTSTIAAGDWLKITGTMTGLGVISGLYRVSRIIGSAIYFDARSESDNLYYWYDPIRDSLSGVTVTFDPIQFIASIPSTGKFRTSAQAIGTATVVGSTALLTTSFTTTGTYLLSADWSGRITAPKYFPQLSQSTQLIVTDRADYPLSLVLSDRLGSTSSSVYQLNTASIVITGQLNTATTGTITLIEIVNGTDNIVSTSSFTGTNVAQFIIDPNQLFTTASSHLFRVDWEGQAWVPNQFFPYYPKSSTLFTQNVDFVQLTASVSTSLNTIMLPNTITAIANTTTAQATTVAFYNGETLLGRVSNNNNSATITLSSGTLAIGQNNIKAIWENINPVSISNIVTATIVPRVAPNLTFTINTSTYQMYEQDGTPTAIPLTATIRGIGVYENHAPLGTYSLSDTVSGTIGTTSSVVQTAFTSTGTISWQPAVVGQLPGVRTILSQYGADDWNLTAVSTSSSITLTKPIPDLSFSVTSTSVINTTTFASGGLTTLSLTKINGGTLTAPTANVFRRQYENTGTMSVQWNNSKTGILNVAYDSNGVGLQHDQTPFTLSTGFFGVDRTFVTYPIPIVRNVGNGNINDSPYGSNFNNGSYGFGGYFLQYDDWLAQTGLTESANYPRYSGYRQYQFPKYIQFGLNNLQTPNDGNYTISVWIKPDIYRTGVSDSPIFGGTGRTATTPNVSKYQIRINHANQKLELRGGPAFSGGLTTVLQSNNTIPLNVWTHIAIIKNNGVTNIYINGVLDSSTTTSLPLGGSGPFIETAWWLGYYSDVTLPVRTSFSGRMANFILIKEAYWTSNFTPPTFEFIRSDWQVTKFFLTATNVSGVLSTSTNLIPANTCTFYAEYGGDAIYQSNTSSSITKTFT